MDIVNFEVLTGHILEVHSGILEVLVCSPEEMLRRLRNNLLLLTGNHIIYVMFIECYFIVEYGNKVLSSFLKFTF